MRNKGLMLNNQWAKPKIQKVQLLKGILSIIKDFSTSDYQSLPSSAVDTIEAIKLEDNAGLIGWKLISRALVDALLNLITENSFLFKKDEIVVDHLDKKMNLILESDQYFISTDFFRHPDKSPIIQKLKPSLEEFLKLFDLKIMRSKIFFRDCLAILLILL